MDFQQYQIALPLLWILTFHSVSLISSLDVVLCSGICTLHGLQPCPAFLDFCNLGKRIAIQSVAENTFTQVRKGELEISILVSTEMSSPTHPQ